jgi:hypothetical protein
LDTLNVDPLLPKKEPLLRNTLNAIVALLERPVIYASIKSIATSLATEREALAPLVSE